jgi:hypothetical protein
MSGKNRRGWFRKSLPRRLSLGRPTKTSHGQNLQRGAAFALHGFGSAAGMQRAGHFLRCDSVMIFIRQRLVPANAASNWTV